MSCTLRLSEVVHVVRGQTSEPSSDLLIQGVCSDSRKLKAGELFVALRGDHFDGHQFIQEALSKGASAVLAEASAALPKTKGPLILVDDTLKALQALAQFWRRKQGFQVLAITGSNGKTTAKEFTRQLLSSQLKVHASQGSYNNHLGVPLSLLEVDESIDFHIQEMGMNALGEIARLCEIAEPNVVACTMVGTAHIGELGSQEAVAQAKEEIYRFSPQAQFIFNLDNEWTRKMYEARRDLQPKKPHLCFSSFDPKADVFLRAEVLNDRRMLVSGTIGGVSGKASVEVFGRQNVVNLMVACCFGLSVKMTPAEIWEALPKCQTSWGRNQWLQSARGFSVLFDGYNANPESMRSLLTNLFETRAEGQKIFLVLGEMKELGELSPQAHRELGALAGQTEPEVIWYVGQYASNFKEGIESSGFKKSLIISESYDETLANKLSAMLGPRDVVAIKASRALRLERLLEKLV